MDTAPLEIQAPPTTVPHCFGVGRGRPMVQTTAARAHGTEISTVSVSWRLCRPVRVHGKGARAGGLAPSEKHSRLIACPHGSRPRRAAVSATPSLHKPCIKVADSRTAVGHARLPCWSRLASGTRRPPARPAARPGNGQNIVTYHLDGHALFTPHPRRGSEAIEAVLARCGPSFSTSCSPRCTGTRRRRGGGGAGVHARPRRDEGWTPARGAVYQSAPAAAAVVLPGPPPAGAPPTRRTPLLAHNGGGWHRTGRARRVRGAAGRVWEGPPVVSPASLCHAPAPPARLRRPPRCASLIPLKAAASRAESWPRSLLYAVDAPRPVEPSLSYPLTRRALPHPVLQPSPQLRVAREARVRWSTLKYPSILKLTFL